MSEVIAHKNTFTTPSTRIPLRFIVGVFDEFGIFGRIVNAEISKQNSESDRIAEAIATSTEEAERSWLLNLHKGIESSRAYLQSYEQRNQLDDLDQAISARRVVINLAAKDDPLFSGQLCSLGYVLYLRFKHSKQRQDVAEAIALYRETASRITRYVDLMHHLYFFSWVLFQTFIITHERCHIDEAIEVMKDVVDIVETNHLVSGTVSGNTRNVLSVLLMCRDTHGGDFSYSDINQAIDFQHEETDKRPGDFFTLVDLSTTYICYFFVTKELRHLDKAIELKRRALSVMPLRHLSFQVYLEEFGESLEIRYEETRDLQDLEEAIAAMHRAIETCNYDDSKLGLYFQNLGDLHSKCPIHTSDLGDARMGITSYREAVLRTLRARINLLGMLNRLTNCLRMSDSIDNISKAISFLRSAVDITAQDGVENIIYREYLGDAFLKKYSLPDDQEDLHSGVNSLLEALSLCHSSDTEHRRRIYRNMTRAVMSSGERSSQRMFIYIIIEHVQRTIQACSDDDMDIWSDYMILGDLYSRCYQLVPNANNAQKAITAYKEGLHRTPAGHSDMPIILRCLGQALCQSESFDDILDSFSYLQRAIDITVHYGTRNPAYTMGALGETLIKKYTFSGDKNDLDYAIDILRKSVSICPPDQLGRLGSTLILLLQALLKWLLIYGKNSTEKLRQIQLEVTDDAISVVESAMQIRLPGNEMNMLTSVLAGLMLIRYIYRGRKDNIKCSLSLMRQVALDSSATLEGHCISAHTCGWFSEEVEDVQDTSAALEAFKLLLDNLIPQVMWTEHTLEKRHVFLALFEDTVTRAVSMAADIGDNKLSLQFVEQGRSIGWNQLNRLRMPLDDLQGVDPVLCEEMKKAGAAFYEDSIRMSQGWDFDLVSDVICNRENGRNLAKQWDSLLSQARGIPGFEYIFKYNPTLDLAASLPRDGIFVVINIHKSTCHAIIISRLLPELVTTTRTHVTYDIVEFLRRRLDKLIYTVAARMRTERTGRLAENTKSNYHIKMILGALWYLLVEPIIHIIGLQPTPNPPRIWWCPTGPLAFLSLHAAGDYHDDAPSNSNVMAYVISSYTFTLTALAEGLSKHSQQQSHKFKGLLAVSEAEAPGLPRIPNTVNESRAIETIFRSSSQKLRCKEGIEATAKSVLGDMPSYSWIHLAYHALQNDSPLQSAFYLHDGPLTLRDIMQNPLPDAQFAFLSACETGKGDNKEEAVHLAGGMLAAGYTSVVATTWSIRDDYAPLVTKEFYTYILQNGEELEERNSARLRAAVGISAKIWKRRYQKYPESVVDDDTIPRVSHSDVGRVRVTFDAHLKNDVQNDIERSKTLALSNNKCSKLVERGDMKLYPDCTIAAAALHHAIGRFRALVGDDEDGLILWVPYFHVGI